MERKFHFALCLAAVGAAAALGSCRVEEALTDGAARVGEEVRFGASASYGEETPGTRTAFSGKVSGTVERIDWSEGDQVTIYSPDARRRNGDADSATYVLSGVSTAREVSKGALSPLKGGNGLVWAEGTNRFRAVYPSTVFTGTLSRYVRCAGLDKGTGELSLLAYRPAVQTPLNGSEAFVDGMLTLAPDMKYATLVAGTEATSADGSVSLRFRPAYTAFQFTLDGGAEGFLLKSFRLYSQDDKEYLSGCGVVTVGGGDEAIGYEVMEEDGEAGQQLSVKAGHEIALGGMGEGILVPAGQKLRFTLFAHCIDYKELLVVEAYRAPLGGGEAARRVMKLQRNVGGSVTPMQFAAGKKYNMNLGELTGEVWTYEDLVISSTVEVSYEGDFVALSDNFRSVRTSSDGRVEAVPYWAEWSEDGGKTWVSVDKAVNSAWLDIYSPSSLAGNTEGEVLSLSVSAQNVSSASGSPRGAMLAKADKKDFDLSTVNVATGGTCATSTANMYLVDAPGTYQFPLVYGCGLKNGAVNTSAYRTSAPFYVDAHGNAIKSATGANGVYIAEHSGNSVDKLEACVIWQDVKGLVVNPRIVGSGQNACLHFDVPRGSIDQGTAVVAVRRKGNKTVEWAWTIWVTSMDYRPTQNNRDGKTVFPSDPLCTTLKEAGNTYDSRSCMLRVVNEGRTSNEVTVNQTGGTIAGRGARAARHWQWGRIIPQANYTRGASSAPVWGAGYSAEDANIGSDAFSSLGESIARSYASIGASAGSGSLVWVLADAYHAWDASSAAAVSYVDAMSKVGDSDRATERSRFEQETVKSLYDPCPVGYKVPAIHRHFPNPDGYPYPSGWNIVLDSNENRAVFSKDGLSLGAYGIGMCVGDAYWDGGSTMVYCADLSDRKYGKCNYLYYYGARLSKYGWLSGYSFNSGQLLTYAEQIFGSVYDQDSGIWDKKLYYDWGGSYASSVYSQDCYRITKGGCILPVKE